eukprot:ctg_255.g140
MVHSRRLGDESIDPSATPPPPGADAILVNAARRGIEAARARDWKAYARELQHIVEPPQRPVSPRHPVHPLAPLRAECLWRVLEALCRQCDGHSVEVPLGQRLESVRACVQEAGVIPVLTRLLQRCDGESPVVLEHAARALTCFAYGDRTVEACLAQDALDALWSVVERHSEYGEERASGTAMVAVVNESTWVAVLQAVAAMLRSATAVARLFRRRSAASPDRAWDAFLHDWERLLPRLPGDSARYWAWECLAECVQHNRRYMQAAHELRILQQMAVDGAGPREMRARMNAMDRLMLPGPLLSASVQKRVEMIVNGWQKKMEHADRAMAECTDPWTRLQQHSLAPPSHRHVSSRGRVKRARGGAGAHGAGGGGRARARLDACA